VSYSEEWECRARLVGQRLLPQRKPIRTHSLTPSPALDWKTDLDILKAEALKLKSDLAALVLKARPLIADYRARASAAANQGDPIPPVPVELHQLDAERTALSINHMVILQTS
jgi:hypothetical protein